MTYRISVKKQHLLAYYLINLGTAIFQPHFFQIMLCLLVCSIQFISVFNALSNLTFEIQYILKVFSFSQPR